MCGGDGDVCTLLTRPTWMMYEVYVFVHKTYLVLSPKLGYAVVRLITVAQHLECALTDKILKRL